MPREDIDIRLAKLAAEIAELEGAWARGERTPGLRGRLRFLKRRQAWYQARQYVLGTGGRTFSLRQYTRVRPPATPDDLILDVRALL